MKNILFLQCIDIYILFNRERKWIVQGPGWKCHRSSSHTTLM